ncbi:TAP-like protein-domain-containing protein [Crepidotus variabilis]|uniref:TAP-like protein-domain-containing protein n=1 Tax=Crepidotus variabilis TaxID=179855 RepID=A0A9P6EHQ2_9AGAR|nr:TAP-like protein-domain-containing protein [Crepidotus variabilis]
MSRRAVLLSIPVACCFILGSLIASNQLFRISNPAALLFESQAQRLLPNAYQATFEWSELPARKDLQWVNCHVSFQCARLIVPLDYTDPDGREATIAIIRKPAAVPQDSKEYRGPILINPGGPGGSGVSTVLAAGFLLGSILGPHFDVVGFDPRGIGESTPKISFFKTMVERELYEKPKSVNIADGTLSRLLSSRKLFNTLAAELDDGYLRHMNTDYTARDMLRIVEAHGRKKLMYWGFSYGSVLGATFAAMFPDKVERVLIDGVVDSEGYYANDWSSAGRDTDKSLDSFFVGCSKAGPDICPFYAPSPEDIRTNLTNIFENLRKSPLPVRTEQSYGLLDESFLRLLIFAGLYSPYAEFPVFAKGLASLANGDGRPLFREPPPFKCLCNPHQDEKPVELLPDALSTLVCNDGDHIPDALEFAEKTFKGYQKNTEFADVLAAVAGPTCAGWPRFQRNHIFRGPFTANTSHPVMLIGNKADPVTPLASAKKMSKGFHGSVVLTQDSGGHASIAAPSICTMKYIQDYFVKGTLPKEGTVCPTIRGPFDPIDAFKYDGQKVFSAEEMQFAETVNELSMTPIIPRMF